MIISKVSKLGGTILALGVLATATPTALADHDVYPPGWNKEPDPNVPQPMFDFRSGWGWDDYQRYWPDQALRTSPKSRPLSDVPVIHGMTPEGHRFHEAQ